ncbi:single-stranded DNA-binding protein [Verrucomicrobiota bacterium]
MTNVNHVLLAGNLTRDPRVRKVSTGATVADLSLATAQGRKNDEKNGNGSTCYVDISLWGKQAETCGEHLAKGSHVLVEGKLHFDQWETENGEKRNKLRVRASRVDFLGRPVNNGKNE